MFKKKEDNIKYFLGGTAVGVAASLLVGKLLSNTSTTKSHTFEPRTSLIEEKKKYSQDDNIHNLYLRGNTHLCHMRSKSASRCESKSCEGQPVPATSSTTLNNNFTNNINNLDCEKRYSTNVQKICYNNNYQVYNISMEDNAGYNVSNEVFSNCKEKKEYNNSILSESKNMEMESLCTVQSEIDGLTNMKDKSSPEATNKNLPKDTKTSDTRKLLKISNNLIRKVHADDSTAFKNVQDTESFMINANISQGCVERANNMATYNSILDFKSKNKDEDEDESRMLHVASFENIREADLISSTKQNNLDNA